MMSNPSKKSYPSQLRRNIDSDFVAPAPPASRSTVKSRTSSEPPEVPPELLETNKEEDCVRLASVASVARMRRMSTADENPHRFRRHAEGQEKSSLLLSMNPEKINKPSQKKNSKELRRCDSECSLIRGQASGGTSLSTRALIAAGHMSMKPLVPSTKFDIGIADTIGRRDQMQDSYAVCGNFGGDPDNNLFLLLDGHSGKEAADIAATRMPAYIRTELDSGKEPEEALRCAFREIHELLLKDAPHCGTTATALLFLGDRSWVAHVGDSRAVTVAEDLTLKRLTVDHRPSNEDEAAAVRSRGAFVLSFGSGNLRVNGVIAITRSLGDKSLADALTCEPDITEFSVPPGGTIVLACDGLWDSVTDENVARIAGDKTLDCKEAAEVLRDSAYKNGSFDNISVMVIRAVR